MGSKPRQGSNRFLGGLGLPPAMERQPFQFTYEECQDFLRRIQLNQLTRLQWAGVHRESVFTFVALHSFLDPDCLRDGIAFLGWFYEDDDIASDPQLLSRLPGDPLRGFLSNIGVVSAAVQRGEFESDGTFWNALPVLERITTKKEFDNFVARKRLEPWCCEVPGSLAWRHEAPEFNALIDVLNRRYRPKSHGGSFDEDDRSTYPDVTQDLFDRGWKRTPAKRIARVLRTDKERKGGSPPGPRKKRKRT